MFTLGNLKVLAIFKLLQEQNKDTNYAFFQKN